MDVLIPASFKDSYLKLIASGSSESKALASLKVDWLDFFELCAKDPDFRKDIKLAREARAEIWIDKITDSVNSEVPLTPAQIPAEKLKFEQLKFLAKADNPDRYGENSGKAAQLTVNLNEFKLLPPQEAIRVLNNDPFNKMVTIEAEASDVKEE